MNVGAKWAMRLGMLVLRMVRKIWTAMEVRGGRILKAEVHLGKSRRTKRPLCGWAISPKYEDPMPIHEVTKFESINVYVNE